MSVINGWINHTPMSDPAEHAPRMGDLPADIGVLNQVIQGLLVHSALLNEYGLDENLLHAGSRQTLPIAQRLTEILKSDGQPLHIPRPPDRRAIGTDARARHRTAPRHPSPTRAGL